MVVVCDVPSQSMTPVYGESLKGQKLPPKTPSVFIFSGHCEKKRKGDSLPNQTCPPLPCLRAYPKRMRAILRLVARRGTVSKGAANRRCFMAAQASGGGSLRVGEAFGNRMRQHRIVLTPEQSAEAMRERPASRVENKVTTALARKTELKVDSEQRRLTIQFSDGDVRTFGYRYTNRVPRRHPRHSMKRAKI
jgi:hypothetical protein